MRRRDPDLRLLRFRSPSGQTAYIGDRALVLTRKNERYYRLRPRPMRLWLSAWTAPLSGQSVDTPPAVNESKQTVFKLFSPKAAELSGVAGEFRCTACIAHKSLRICERCRLAIWHNQRRIQLPVDGIQTIRSCHRVHSLCAFACKRSRVRR
jgi:hypothetical protein